MRMRKWVLTSARTALLTAGFVVMGSGVAMAHAGAVTSGDGSLGGGGQIVADAEVWGDVCGDAIAVLGVSGASCTNPGAIVIEGQRGAGDRSHQLAQQDISAVELLSGVIDEVEKTPPAQLSTGGLVVGPVGQHLRSGGGDIESHAHRTHQSGSVVGDEDTALYRKGVSIGYLIDEQADQLAGLTGLRLLDGVKVTGI